jgi:hypothetical protein
VKLPLVILVMTSACGATVPLKQNVQLSSQEVEAAHLEQLNSWIAEQDRVNPPAPSVARPSDFSEAQCVLASGNNYKCNFSFAFGGARQKVSATFHQSRSGSWSILDKLN